MMDVTQRSKIRFQLISEKFKCIPLSPDDETELFFRVSLSCQSKVHVTPLCVCVCVCV